MGLFNFLKKKTYGEIMLFDFEIMKELMVEEFQEITLKENEGYGIINLSGVSVPCLFMNEEILNKDNKNMIDFSKIWMFEEIGMGISKKFIENSHNFLIIRKNFKL